MFIVDFFFSSSQGCFCSWLCLQLWARFVRVIWWPVFCPDMPLHCIRQKHPPQMHVNTTESKIPRICQLLSLQTASSLVNLCSGYCPNCTAACSGITCNRVTYTHKPTHSHTQRNVAIRTAKQTHWFWHKKTNCTMLCVVNLPENGRKTRNVLHGCSPGKI